MLTNFRDQAHGFLNQLISAPEHELKPMLEANLTEDSTWDVSFPVNRLTGVDAVLEGLINPLRRALPDIRRRDEIFVGGENRLGPGEWVASVTHYVGNFKEALMGISPNERLIFLRSGEFYRIEHGRVAEAKLIIDFLDLLRQIDRFPLPRMLGTEMLFPGPATHDGVLPGNRERDAATLDLVEAMLRDLTAYDPETFTSPGQTGKDGAWHDDMLWYGPAGIGSNYRWEGFEKDHRAAFLTAFPDRVGGDHYCHIGDGDYAAVGGWPAMTMTHKGDYLGIVATNRALTLRVMDFYRCGCGKIMENWVCLDYLDMFNQMGVDLIARAEEMA